MSAAEIEESNRTSERPSLPRVNWLFLSLFLIFSLSLSLSLSFFSFPFPSVFPVSFFSVDSRFTVQPFDRGRASCAFIFN